ncbi:MAG: alanine racemase [Chloroflexota bacterium]
MNLSARDSKQMWQGRPLWAEIDLDAIALNTRELRRRAGERAALLAVVKANAYGHGAVAVARTVAEAGARHLGVACSDEGIQLRRAGIDLPILVMGYVALSEAEKIVAHDLSPTLNTRQLALAVAGLSAQRGVTTTVHLKMDTGMNRFGLLPQEVTAFAEFVRTLPGLKVGGIYTHFAVADEADKTFTRQQFNTFIDTAARLPWILCRHVANSATILDTPEMCLEMVRPGIALYGVYPSGQVTRSVELRPALSLKSRVARLHDLAPGESVSYGRTWTADRPSRVALIPSGYADGIRRCLSNKGLVLIRGQRAPIRGRICMDQFVVDVSHIPDVQPNDEVVLIGRQGEEEIMAEEVAALAETISYEIFCGISARVPRVYMRDGVISKAETLVQAADRTDSA